MILGQSDRHRSHKSDAVCRERTRGFIDRVKLTIQGIAPCGSCHGSLDNKIGSVWLEGGQSARHMRDQLQAFAGGQRRNDISQQMRNIARAITPQEIEEAAANYASQPPAIVKATV
jgi:cytochrome c553